MNERSQKITQFFAIGFGLLLTTGLCVALSGIIAWTLGMVLNVELIILTAFVCTFINMWAGIALTPEQPQIGEKKDDNATPDDDDLGTP